MGMNNQGANNQGAQGEGNTGNNSGDPNANKNKVLDDKSNKGTQGGNQDGNTQNENHPGDDDPMWSDPLKVKNYVKDLRKESASYRTKAKEFQGKLDEMSGKFSNLEGGLKKALGLGEDDLPPEEQVKHLNQAVDGLHFENAVNDIFIEQGLPGGKKGAKYFSFLLQEAASELGENDEVSEEKMEEIITQVKTTFGNKQNSTSIDSGNGGTPPKPDNNGTITLDAFVSMSLASKTELYHKNKSLYETLMKQAKDKRLI